MTLLTYEETKEFVDFVLNSPLQDMRFDLFILLARSGKNEGQLYEGIIRHHKGLGLTNEQWFELLCRLPNRMPRSGLSLSKILSENQIAKLPSITG